MSTKPNVIVLAIDTLRADHLGCYGYPLPTSPNIDAMARQGVLAENLYCAALPTYPSFTTFYTGQHPITHGIVQHGGKAQLSKEAPFVTQSFLEAGYATCAVDNLNRARQWFARGYEYYIDPSLRRTLLLGVTCEELNRRAIPWIREHADEPFFLFIHYWDPHWPYTPPARLRHLFYDGTSPTDPNNHALDEWWKSPLGAMAKDTWLRTADGVVTDPACVSAMYDQQIRHVDEGIGQVLGALDDLGLSDRTLTILFGDHGESLTEHNIFFDHHGLYDCTLHVPLILRWPGHLDAGKRVSPMFQHYDIAPTLLESAGLQRPRGMDGSSFWPIVTGEQVTGGRDRLFSAECTRMAKWSLRTADYKFILAREPDLAYGTPSRELFDLRADPDEKRNLVSVLPDLAASMETELEQWIAQRLRELGKKEDPVRELGLSLGWEVVA
jgi:arylsulfatase A-like enzyme